MTLVATITVKCEERGCKVTMEMETFDPEECPDVHLVAVEEMAEKGWGWDLSENRHYCPKHMTHEKCKPERCRWGEDCPRATA